MDWKSLGREEGKQEGGHLGGRMRICGRWHCGSQKGGEVGFGGALSLSRPTGPATALFLGRGQVSHMTSVVRQ